MYGGPCVEVFRDFMYLSEEIFFVRGNINIYSRKYIVLGFKPGLHQAPRTSRS